MLMGCGLTVTSDAKSMKHCTWTNLTILLGAGVSSAINDGKKNFRATSNCGIIDAVAIGFMEGKDRKAGKVHPPLLEIVLPVVQKAFEG
jgi:hypothetical protein